MSIPVPHFLTDHLTMSVRVSLFTAHSLFYSPLPSTALCPLCSALPSTALCLFCSTLPSTALCPLYSLLYLSGPMPPIWPSFPFSALSPLYGLKSPLRPSVPSSAVSPLYGSLSLQGLLSHPWPLSPLSFTALCPLYGPLTHLLSSVPSSALCLLDCPLSSLRLPLALRPIYGPLSPHYSPSLILVPSVLL